TVSTKRRKRSSRCRHSVFVLLSATSFEGVPLSGVAFGSTMRPCDWSPAISECSEQTRRKTSRLSGREKAWVGYAQYTEIGWVLAKLFQSCSNRTAPSEFP